VVCDYLTQKSRTQLFSNALPPAVCYGAMAAIDVLLGGAGGSPGESGAALLERLRKNVQHFRQGMRGLGLKTIEGITPIVPVMVGETPTAIAMQKALFEEGVFVSGFGYPVVPTGEARLRCQISAGHTIEDLDQCLAAFRKVAERFPEARGEHAAAAQH
jgi:glycine C-acetyltransferase